VCSPVKAAEAPPDSTSQAALAKLLESTMAWIEGDGRYHEDKFRVQQLERCREALAKLQSPA
jgi:hypothetical protein